MIDKFKITGSMDRQVNTSLSRSHTILFACFILDVIQNAGAFSIQQRHLGYQQTATKSIHIRNKRIFVQSARLDENSLRAVQNEINEESTVQLSSINDRYTFQSQTTTRENQRTKNTDNSTQAQSFAPEFPSVIPATCNQMSDLQIMTLKSKITKYLVDSTTVSINGVIRKSDTKKRSIILWRNLLNDTPELHGYPISFLAEHMKLMMQYLDQTSNTTSALSSTELALKHIIDDAEIDWDYVLPYLDAYTFEVGGGVTGLVYGAIGVADGTQICTSSVGDVQSTIPRNYILTGDKCLYELGRPAFSNDSLSLKPQTRQSYSLSGTTKEWFSNGKDTASLIVKNIGRDDDKESSDELVIYSDLWRLAGLTTLVLSGAMAMETLSHHLTVNVFWV